MEVTPFSPRSRSCDKGEMIVGVVGDTVGAIVRPAVGTLVNVGFLREDNAVSPASVVLLTVTEGTSNRPGGKLVSRSRWCTPRWPFSSGRRGVRINLSWWLPQHALAFLVDARETIGPFGAVRCHGERSRGAPGSGNTRFGVRAEATR